MPKGLKGFQKGNKEWNQPNSIKNLFKKGHKPWNTNTKGLLKIGQGFQKGKDNPNYGGLSEKHKEKIGKANMGNKSALGKHWKMSEESKRKNRERQIAHPNRKFKDTSIELKIEAELKRRNINYQKQVPLCKIAIVDFYLPEHKIVIQCDGDYWHNLSGIKERDIKQDKVLTFNGFNIYRFWQHEIDKSSKKCIDKLFIPLRN